MKNLELLKVEKIFYLNGTSFESNNGYTIKLDMPIDGINQFTMFGTLIPLKEFIENGELNSENLALIGAEYINAYEIKELKLVNYLNKVITVLIKYTNKKGNIVDNEFDLNISNYNDYLLLKCLYNQENINLYSYSNGKVEQRKSSKNNLKGNEDLKNFLLSIDINKLKDTLDFDHEFQSINDRFFDLYSIEKLHELTKNKSYIHLK